MAGRDVKAIDALPYPIWGFDPPSPEPDTKKLDALLDSLNGSAERFQTLWFSFLGLTLYLAIGALATTHRMLLLGEPRNSPYSVISCRTCRTAISLYRRSDEGKIRRCLDHIRHTRQGNNLENAKHHVQNRRCSSSVSR
jgi:hypothetical protein